MALTKDMQILVVDDMESYRVMMVDCLKKIGFINIDQAENGVAAWEKISQRAGKPTQFKLVISDMHMPQCNGLELLKAIKEQEVTRSIYFLMVSTENESEVIIKAIELGASNYVLKPYNKDTIAEKIGAIFKHK